MRSTNLTIAKTTPPRYKIKGSKDDSPFAPAQDQLKTMSDFFNSAASKLTADFNSEGPVALSEDSTKTDINETNV